MILPDHVSGLLRTHPRAALKECCRFGALVTRAVTSVMRSKARIWSASPSDNSGLLIARDAPCAPWARRGGRTAQVGA